MTPTPDVAALTQFDYLLNAFEHASQSAEPAKHGYGAKRRALFAYVRQLERDSAALSAAEKRADLLQGALERADRLAATERNRARLAEGLLREARQELIGTHDFLQGGMSGSTVAFTVKRIDAALKQGEQPS